MADLGADIGADTILLSYADLAARLKIAPDSARRLVHRRRWARRSNNEGRTLVAVPRDYLEREAVTADVRADVHPDIRADVSTDVRADIPPDVRADSPSDSGADVRADNPPDNGADVRAVVAALLSRMQTSKRRSRTAMP